MINKELEYQPKGSMCGTCLNSLNDCSKYDFSKMIKISKGDRDGVVIVRCSYYEEIDRNNDYDPMQFHECPACNFRCNCGCNPCECDCSTVDHL